jgi:hypothetical protein
MKRPIYFFLKFCEKARYADDFIAGRLWMNPLGYFRALEDVASDGRGDEHEGLVGWYQPSRLGIIQVGPVTIPPTDLAGPVIVQSRETDNANVLCLYEARAPFSPISAAELEEHLRIPARCRSMGKFVVLIHPPDAFIKRVIAAANAKGFTLSGGSVEYFDPDSFSGHVDHVAFAKKRDYAWQREYRFVIERGVEKPEPFVLEVGSLRDLCTVVDAARLGDVRVFPPGE